MYDNAPFAVFVGLLTVSTAVLNPRHLNYRSLFFYQLSTYPGIVLESSRFALMLFNSINGFFSFSKGIFEEDFVKPLLQPEFLKALVENTDESNSWENKYGKSVKESLRDSLVDNLGKPIDEFFT